jgi:hypothetical protein
MLSEARFHFLQVEIFQQFPRAGIGIHLNFAIKSILFPSRNLACIDYILEYKFTYLLTSMGLNSSSSRHLRRAHDKNPQLLE